MSSLRFKVFYREIRSGIQSSQHCVRSDSPEIPANIEQLFTPSETRPNYIFQTFLYAAIMSRQQSLMVAPALLYIHRAASENYSPVIEMGEPRKPNIPVNNFAFFED